MDWMTWLSQMMGPGGAMAGEASAGAGGMAGDLGVGSVGAPQPTGFDETGVGAPMGPQGLPPGAVQPRRLPVLQPAPANQPTGLGASLEPEAPAGSPMDIRSLNQKRMDGNTSGAVQMADKNAMANRITAALRGVQAPPKPDVLKPSTPAAPHAPRAIQGNELLQLLNSLGNPRQPLVGPGRATTLGGALGIGRY